MSAQEVVGGDRRNLAGRIKTAWDDEYLSLSPPLNAYQHNNTELGE